MILIEATIPPVIMALVAEWCKIAWASIILLVALK